jgi:hypothetical protein
MSSLVVLSPLCLAITGNVTHVPFNRPYPGFPLLGAAMNTATTRMWVCEKCLSNLRSGPTFLLFFFRLFCFFPFSFSMVSVRQTFWLPHNATLPPLPVDTALTQGSLLAPSLTGCGSAIPQSPCSPYHSAAVS